MSRIAIIGHGAVARYLARAMEPGSITAVLARPGRAAAARSAIPTDHVVHSAADLPLDPDCVVDCAGHAGLRVHGAAILSAGIDLITVSIGALADDGLRRDLDAAAKAGDSRLHLATGAIGALDALSAASAGALEEVRYTGRKPPESWLGSAAEQVVDLSRLTEAEVHFDGTARDCALRYPKNANVAAAVALAGLGWEATRAQLIADPTVTRNIHEIEAIGDFGRFQFVIEGQSLPDNPKSSALTAMSVVQAVARRKQTIGF